MPRMLQIYSGNLAAAPGPAAMNMNGGSQVRAVVAARSWAEVARITRVGMHYLRTYWFSPRDFDTSRSEHVQARDEPGVLFWRPTDAEDEAPYVRAGETYPEDQRYSEATREKMARGPASWGKRS